MPEPGVALEKLGFLTLGWENQHDLATQPGPALGWAPKG